MVVFCCEGKGVALGSFWAKDGPGDGTLHSGRIWARGEPWAIHYSSDRFGTPMLCPRPPQVSCGFVCCYIVYVFAILLGSSSVRRATGGIKYRNQGGVPEVGSNIEIKLRRDQVVHLSPSPPQTRGGGGRRPPASKWWWGWREGGGYQKSAKTYALTHEQLPKLARLPN